MSIIPDLWDGFVTDDPMLRKLAFIGANSYSSPKDSLEMAVDCLFREVVFDQMPKSEEAWCVIEQLSVFTYNGKEMEDLSQEQQAHWKWLYEKLAEIVIPLCKSDTTGLLEWLNRGAILVGHTPEWLAEVWDRGEEINAFPNPNRLILSAEELVNGRRTIKQK